MKKIISASYTLLLIVSMVFSYPFVMPEILKPYLQTPETEPPINQPDDTISQPDKKPEENIPPPLEIPLEFEIVEADYFDDALFIGDSRTVGLYEYGNLKNATYFASTGLSVFQAFENPVEVIDYGEILLTDLLEQADFKKVYIMLGVNELGYGHDSIVNKYSELVETVITMKPEAIIYLQANLHMTKEGSDADDTFNNKNIDLLNDSIKEMTNNETIFYIDVNEIFDDETGNLDPELTSDHSHVRGKHYAEWSDWLMTQAIELR